MPLPVATTPGENRIRGNACYYSFHRRTVRKPLRIPINKMSLFLNGRSLSCLVCSKSSDSCLDQEHPLQRLLSYDELIGKYARKINRQQHDGISIYTCPYCGLDRLTIDALYTHSRGTHLPGSAGPTEQHPPAVHCPVCVCFRLENCTAFVQDTGGLVEHMLSRHCFSSTLQYSDEFKLRSDFCNDDEFELIRFLATFLPPAVITSQSALEEDELAQTLHRTLVRGKKLLPDL
uniref:Uncharacterized protein n=1 Tax=Anopheles atroparvus TaxID=41427 RepID=A0A182IT21_ANOAO